MNGAGMGMEGQRVCEGEEGQRGVLRGRVTAKGVQRRGEGLRDM